MLLLLMTGLLSLLPNYNHVMLQLLNEDRTTSFYYMRFFKSEQIYERVLFLDNDKIPVANWYDLDLKLEIYDKGEDRFVRIFFYDENDKEVEILRAKCYQSIQTYDCEYGIYQITHFESFDKFNGASYDLEYERNALLIVEHCPCRKNSIDVWIMLPCDEIAYWPLYSIPGVIGFISRYLDESGQSTELDNSYDYNEDVLIGGESGSGNGSNSNSGSNGSGDNSDSNIVPEPPTILLVSVAVILIVVLVLNRNKHSSD